MRVGTPVSILIRNKFQKEGDPAFVKVPGIVMGDPQPSSYTNRNTGAVVQSQTVEVVSLRDTRESNPQGGRCWYQQTNEPVNLLVRRFDPVEGLDIENGQRLTTRDLYQKVEASIIDFRLRQAAFQPASDLTAPAAAPHLVHEDQMPLLPEEQPTA